MKRAAKVGHQLEPSVDKVGQAAAAAALTAVATAPFPAAALEEDEEGFDIRILAVLVLPLTAVSWALFNVWRVAFRQVVRIGDSTSGSSKAGLRKRHCQKCAREQLLLAAPVANAMRRQARYDA